MKYRVTYEGLVRRYVDINAESEAAAYEKARNMDTGDLLTNLTPGDVEDFIPVDVEQFSDEEE